MSTSKQNDGTSFKPSEQKPCANNCGFFGSAATMNFCSKCFRDLRVKEDQAASAKAAVVKSLNPSNQLSKPETNSQTSAEVDSEASPSCTAAETKVANRCLSCNRKVGLTGFVCKCGYTFCRTHRYPEEHECTFDFKRAARDAIAKANPVVKADKVRKF